MTTVSTATEALICCDPRLSVRWVPALVSAAVSEGAVSALVAQRDRDGIPIDTDMTGSVDVEYARRVVGFWMPRDEIDVVSNAWNGLDALTKAVGVPLGFSGLLANRCYDTLSRGLDVEAVIPPGRLSSVRLPGVAR